MKKKNMKKGKAAATKTWGTLRKKTLSKQKTANSFNTFDVYAYIPMVPPSSGDEIYNID